MRLKWGLTASKNTQYSKSSFPLLSVQKKTNFADPHIFSIIFYGAQLIYGVETLIMRIRLSRQITNQISRRTDKISTSSPIKQIFVAGSASGTACKPKWGYRNTLAITWRPRYLNSKAKVDPTVCRKIHVVHCFPVYHHRLFYISIHTNLPVCRPEQ